MAMSKTGTHVYSGINIRNIENIHSSLRCELCQLLLLHPVQILCCGIRLCRWCSIKGVPNTRPFVCPFCQTEQVEKQIHVDRGVEIELNKLAVECYLCYWRGLYNDYKNHLQEEHAQFQCKGCDEHFFSINLLEEHRETTCQQCLIPCGLPNCKENFKRSEIKNHYMDTKHQMLIVDLILELLHERGLSLTNPLSQSKSVRNLEDQETKKELTALQETITGLLLETDQAMEESRRVKFQYDQSNSGLTLLNENKNRIEKIFNERNEIINELAESINKIQKAVEDMTRKQISSVKLTLPSDSTVTFRFPRNSNPNVLFSLSSPIFRTSTFGYNFMIRVCSTSTRDDEHQEYLSIYITLLRGEYDPILTFPFNYNIHFSLRDQSNQRKDIVGKIIPNEHKMSFIRPITEKNNEVGILKFCPIKLLMDTNSNYLKDNVFFVTIFIDFLSAGPNSSG